MNVIELIVVLPILIIIALIFPAVGGMILIGFIGFIVFAWIFGIKDQDTPYRDDNVL